jgi:GMP synthase (glutamine-hydrolysing)
MTRLLIIQNTTNETPGLIVAALNRRDIGHDIVDLDRGGTLPPLDEYQGVVVMGGLGSANDATHQMAAELKLVAEALAKHVPYLGICLGLQVLVKAAGGRVVPAKVKEIGFRDATGQLFRVELTPEGQIDPVFGGLQNSFNVFQLHGETVELAGDMTLLATGEYCHNQIVRVGDNAYGIQSHFEVTPEMLAEWADHHPDLIHLPKSHLLADYAAIQQSYREVAATIFGRFLDVVALAQRS